MVAIMTLGRYILWKYLDLEGCCEINTIILSFFFAFW